MNLSLSVCLSVCLSIGSAAIVGCAPPSDADGTTAGIVLSTPQVFLTPTYTVNAGEPHAVFVTGGTLPDTFVVGYNRADFGLSKLAWSFLATGDAGFSNCDATTNCGPVAGRSSCRPA